MFLFDKLLCCWRHGPREKKGEVEEIVLKHTNNNQTEYITSAKLLERLKGGTTAVVALVREKRLVVAWLGDSQALLVRRRKAAHVGEPHKPDMESEKKRIEGLGGAVLNCNGTWRVLGQLAVSRAIGDAEYKPFVSSECDIKSLEIIGDEDFLILACDGLWDELRPKEAVNLVYSYLIQNDGDTDGVGRCLVEAARSAGSDDNITAVVVFLRPVQTLMEEEASRIAHGEVSHEDQVMIPVNKDAQPNFMTMFTPPPNLQKSSPSVETLELDTNKNGFPPEPPPDYDTDEGASAANPTAEEVDAALAELDSIPDAGGEGVDSSDEDEWTFSKSNPKNDVSENNIPPMEPSANQDIPQREKSASPKSGSPREVEGFVTSVELNAPEESFNSNFSVNQDAVIESDSGPFSVYVSSSPDSNCIEAPPMQAQSTMEAASPVEAPVDLIPDAPLVLGDQPVEPSVEIVHAQSMVEVEPEGMPRDMAEMPDIMTQSFSGDMPTEPYNVQETPNFDPIAETTKVEFSNTGATNIELSPEAKSFELKDEPANFALNPMAPSFGLSDGNQLGLNPEAASFAPVSPPTLNPEAAVFEPFSEIKSNEELKQEPTVFEPAPEVNGNIFQTEIDIQSETAMPVDNVEAVNEINLLSSTNDDITKPLVDSPVKETPETIINPVENIPEMKPVENIPEIPVFNNIENIPPSVDICPDSNNLVEVEKSLSNNVEKEPVSNIEPFIEKPASPSNLLEKEVDIKPTLQETISEPVKDIVSDIVEDVKHELPEAIPEIVSEVKEAIVPEPVETIPEPEVSVPKPVETVPESVAEIPQETEKEVVVEKPVEKVAPSPQPRKTIGKSDESPSVESKPAPRPATRTPISKNSTKPTTKPLSAPSKTSTKSTLAAKKEQPARPAPKLEKKDARPLAGRTSLGGTATSKTTTTTTRAPLRTTSAKAPLTKPLAPKTTTTTTTRTSATSRPATAPTKRPATTTTRPSPTKPAAKDVSKPLAAKTAPAKPAAAKDPSKPAAKPIASTARRPLIEPRQTATSAARTAGATKTAKDSANKLAKSDVKTNATTRTTRVAAKTTNTTTQKRTTTTTKSGQKTVMEKGKATPTKKEKVEVNGEEKTDDKKELIVMNGDH